MIKKIILFVVVFNLALASFGTAYAEGLGWNEYKAEHFIIYYHPGISSEYIKTLGRYCERYYRLIAERLGFKRFDFWTWENRARIFIYASKQAYLKDRARPEWSAASVIVKRKEIYTYYSGEDSLDTIFPHEISHIILREYIGQDVDLPLWFEEGLACANEEGCLNTENGFYSQAAARVAFLLQNYGRERLVNLCRRIRDGNSFYEAMDKTYGRFSR